MKAYVLNGIGQLDYEDVALPVLKSGWVLIRVGAAGICESDVPRVFKTGTYHFPLIPGHEFSGTVVDTYRKENREWIGKRVGIFPLIPCRECFACEEGSYEMCRNYDYLGSRRDGGFAEFAAVPVWNLIELPEEVGLKEAAMLEPASVALHAVRRLRIEKNTAVALYGLGTIGLLMAQWLHIFGVHKVYAVGHHEENGRKMKKLASGEYSYAQAFGGQGDCSRDSVTWILDKTNGQGVSAAIDCTGTAEGVQSCLRCVRPGGQVLLLGNPKGNMMFDQESYWKILRNQLHVTGTWNSSFSHQAEDDWHTVLGALRDKTLSLSELITHRFAFDRLKQGLLVAKERREYQNKIIICYGDVQVSEGQADI